MRSQQNREAIATVDAKLFDALQRLFQWQVPLVPSDLSPAALNAVLDVGCGMHQWGRMLFQTMHQHVGRDLIDDVRIEGVDHCSEVARAANATIRTGRGQVRVIEEDFFALPTHWTASYDLVHARFLSPYVSSQQWPRLLAEAYRVCKPGGWVMWSEPALPTASAKNPAWQGWLIGIEKALVQLGATPQISASMEALVHQAGAWKRMEIQHVQLQLVSTARGQGFLLMEARQVVCQRLQAFSPILLASGMSPQAVEKGLQAVLNEFNRCDVTSQWPWTILTAQKAEPSRKIGKKNGG